jgi:acetyl esterase/lipase
MNYPFGLLVSVFFLFVSQANGQYCTGTNRFTEVPSFTLNQITVAKNIQFGIASDHLGNPDTLGLDLYYPNLNLDPLPKRPFVMLFHGGGFSSGDKASGDIVDLCGQLALRGFVAASVNYRLGHDFSEYGQYKARYRAIQDGHAAMRYVVQNANAVRIDTSWMFIGGQSAGSLLALGMVYADPTELDSISLLYGSMPVSTELGNLYNSGNGLSNRYTFKGIVNNWGGVTASEMDAAEMIPTVAFHGAQDTTVRIGADDSFLHYTLNGSEAIHNQLVAANICSELNVDPSGGHGIYRNASTAFRAGRTSCFFKRLFCSECEVFYATDSIAANCATALSIGDDPSESIRMYPNPFKNSFQLDGLGDLAEVSIYHPLGQSVYRRRIVNGLVEVDLPPGLYFLKAQGEGTGISFSKRIYRK